MKEIIKDQQGKVLGSIETDSQGNKVVRTWRGVITGFYKKGLNITTDFQGKVIARGDMASALIPWDAK